ncbi:MAG: hypothetical protein M1831_007065 [Alyxoria varia]|nr:MAG: hypothetical protein M1831_007065 [Alyxoria varia]
MTSTTTTTEESFHSSGSNVFNAKVFDEQYWTNYLAARPKYSPEFYDIIYKYHDTHNGSDESSYALAHDVGMGPGQVTGEVAKRVSRVIGSDANSSHVDVAKHRLSDLYAAGKVDFIEALGEEVAAKSPGDARKVDFVVGGESFALMDTDRAKTCFAELLKPGGTLAVWYYGRPIFNGEPKVQEIYNKIVTKIFRPVVSGGNEASRAMWKRSTEIMATWLDNIDFSPEQWTDVQRHKWNSHAPMEFFHDSACDYPIERTSLVSPAEKVIETQDNSFWAEDWDIADVKRFVLANVPTFRESESEEKELEALWEDLDAAMGGKGEKKHITWPVVLVLATRK